MKSHKKIRLVHLHKPRKKFFALLSEFFAIENKSPYQGDTKNN